MVAPKYIGRLVLRVLGYDTGIGCEYSFSDYMHLDGAGVLDIGYV